MSFSSKKDIVSKPNSVDSLFYDGSVVTKLQNLSLDYNNLKESLSDGKLMLDCVSQDLDVRMSQFEGEYHMNVSRLRGGQKMETMTAASRDQLAKRRSVKDKAMRTAVDDRTPLQRKKGRVNNKAVKQEQFDIKLPAEFLYPDGIDDYIPQPK